ncbi:hypothetical protein V8C43DRAFT_288692 [Trichoderma afarasin]
MSTFFSPTAPKRLGPRFDKLEHPIYHAVIFPLTHDGHYLERVTRWHRTLHQLRTHSLFPHSLSQRALTSPSYPALIFTPYLSNKELFMQPTHNIFSFLSSPPFKQITTSPHHFSPEPPNPLSLTIITAFTASSSSSYTRLTRSARHGHCLHSCPGPADQPHALAPQPAPPATNNGAKCAINSRMTGHAKECDFWAILCLQVMSICRRLSAALQMDQRFRRLCFHCGDKVCGEGA